MKRRRGFGVSGQAVLGVGRYEHAGAQVALVVLAGEGVHLSGALQVDILALGLVWVERVEDALHDEARETYELSEGLGFLVWSKGVFNLAFDISQIYEILRLPL